MPRRVVRMPMQRERCEEMWSSCREVRDMDSRRR
jgi:hypothetical protein